MKTIFGLGKVKAHSRKAVLAIGVFDGVHLGHQALLKKVIEKAKEIHGEAIVLTFHPHPVQVLHPEKNLKLLIPLSYRLKLMNDLGVDTAIVVHFTKKFSNLTPQRFIELCLLKHANLSDVFVGGEFRFGHDREGTLEFFKKEGKIFGFQVHGIDVISTHKKNCHSKISSSVIRQYIDQGQLQKASRLLGRPVSFFGKVEKGKKIGSQLGFPTANIYPKNEIYPPLGIYATRVKVGKRYYPSMTYIGRCPSVKAADHQVVIEVHIFSFHQNIYGQEIRIDFLKKIRAEEKFTSEKDLVKQIQKDKIRILRYFK